MAELISIEKIASVLADPTADSRIQEARAQAKLVQRQKLVAEKRTRRDAIQAEAGKVLPALRAEVEQLREAAQTARQVALDADDTAHRAAVMAANRADGYRSLIDAIDQELVALAGDDVAMVDSFCSDLDRLFDTTRRQSPSSQNRPTGWFYKYRSEAETEVWSDSASRVRFLTAIRSIQAAARSLLLDALAPADLGAKLAGLRKSLPAITMEPIGVVEPKGVKGDPKPVTESSRLKALGVQA